MREIVNGITLNGRVYDHSLAVKKVTNETSENYGKEYINGKLDIATDDAGLNVVTVEFAYVAPFTKANAENKTYTALKQIIDSDRTIQKVGIENAIMVDCSPSIDCNAWYDNEDKLIQAKKISGGFVSIVKTLKPENERNRFECDMLISKVILKEADGEKIKDSYAEVHGATFNFRKALIPVSFVVKGDNGIQYFMSLEAGDGNFTFTKVWGSITSRNVSYTKVVESAWGEPTIKEYPRTIREWVLTGSSPELYEIGDATNGITMDEIKEKNQARQVYLAEQKKRSEEYKAKKAATDNTFGGGVTAAVVPESFNF